MFFIRENSKKVRITLVANVIFAFTLLTNSYVYNLMESQAIIENDWTSHYEVNAHNSGPVSEKIENAALKLIFNKIVAKLLIFISGLVCDNDSTLFKCNNVAD